MKWEVKMTLLLIFIFLCTVVCVDPESGGTVQKLLSQRENLIQPGLSFTNITNGKSVSSLSLLELQSISSLSQVSCTISIENWSKWLLANPVYYLQYGKWSQNHHEREIFPSHREVLIAVNDGQKSFTGSSGSVAWELEEMGVHLILVWSLPYNLNFYNSYFGIAVAQLTSRFTKDMLPYWYHQIMESKKGRNFQRGLAGGHLLYKHSDFFVIGEFGTGYHPTLNISVMPWQTKDLSPSIWHKLYIDSLRTSQNSAAFSSCELLMKKEILLLILPISLLLFFVR